MKLTTTTGGTITSASLSQSSKDASGSDDVTFTVTFPHAIPANGMIAITYPLQVSVDSTTLAASLTSPSIIASLTLSLNSAQRKIQITDMFPSGVSAGALTWEGPGKGSACAKRPDCATWAESRPKSSRT